MFELIKRLFAHWHRIPRKKVPRWVRGKLYKQNYVKDRGREYKKVITHHKKQWEAITADDAHWQMNPQPSLFEKKWKRIKFYYRKLEV